MLACAQRLESSLLPLLSPSFPQKLKADILIIDIGGGYGQLLEALRKARPDLNGRMIVQDLPNVIESSQFVEGIEGMAHDYFAPQPVQGQYPISGLLYRAVAEDLSGAYTYYFRHVLHDQPDEACRRILKATASAMKAGYSRLVIMDAVLSSMGASTYASLFDLNMSTIAGGERTDHQWQTLLEAAGLQIVHVEAPPVGDGIIVATLKS